MRSALLLLLTALTLPLFGGEVAFRPAPAWVERIDAATHVAVDRRNARWGIYDVLNDHQVRAGGESEWQYFRTVRKVLSPSGVQNASELSLDFDPSFEKLTIHEVSVIRGGIRVDALEPGEVRVIQKEDDADSRIYDGERTALVFVRDVRPGDVIDYSWSLEGSNPILGGRYTDEYDLSSGVPSRRIRHRLLWPAGRPLQWRGAEPRISTIGGAQELVWTADDIPPLDVEDSIPTWYEPWAAVQVTEFASWAEVASWAHAMFQLDARSTLEVKQLAATITGAHASRDARITAAIRFVQDEIRYLGIEMGRNSHEPHQPWETLDARWGDCKDKTLLLVALLRELGLEAYPALVNTRLQHRLDEKLPSPFLFDHVITQVIDKGRTYWIDGTIADQGGTLTTIETPSDSRALIVRAGTQALTHVITNTKGAIRVAHTYTTVSAAEPVKLEVKTTYSGADADAMRAKLASLSIEDFAHERINDLAVDQPKIEAVGLPAIEDDRLANAITILEHYRVPELWDGGHWTWYPRALESQLTRPDTMIRTMPLAFTHPLDIEQTATFLFPRELNVEKSTSATETPTFRYESTVDSNGKSVTLRQSLRAKRDVIAVKDVAEHLTKLNGIWSEIGYRLAPALPVATARASAMSGTSWGLGLVAVAVFVAFCVLLASRRPQRRAVAAVVPAFHPGEAPASALAVAGAHDIAAHLAALACACGARSYSPADLQRARYAEREMTIATRQCAACGREQSVYFTAA